MPKGERTEKESVVIATKRNKTNQKLQGRGEAEAAHSNTFSRLSKNAGTKQGPGRSQQPPLSKWRAGKQTN
tara:strand:- start:173 stop:385 length:213 start_codon:yes stop_codon:yes gene_type:complete